MKRLPQQIKTDNEKIYAQIACNLVSLRHNNNYTLEEVAGFLGLTDKTSYYAYEICKAQIPVQAVIRLSILYKITTDEILKSVIHQTTPKKTSKNRQPIIVK